jgi:hypothetical protein
MREIGLKKEKNRKRKIRVIEEKGEKREVGKGSGKRRK